MSEANEKPDSDAPEQSARPLAMVAAGLAIDQIIKALIERANKGDITEQLIRDAYEAVGFPAKDVPESIRFSARATYGRLFGFGDSTHNYLSDRDHHFLNASHIHLIAIALHALGITGKPSTFENIPTRWLPFLKQAVLALGRKVPDKLDQALAESSHDIPGHPIEPLAENSPGRPTAMVVGGETSPPFQSPSVLVDQGNTRAFVSLRVRLLALAAIVLVLGSSAVFLLRLPTRVTPPVPVAVADRPPPRHDDKVTPMANSGQIAGFANPRVLVGPNAGSDQSTTSSVLTTKIDPRLEEAARLRSAGSYALADRLMKVVIDEWSQARAVSNKNEADAHRQLGASAYANRNWDGAIAEYKSAFGIDATADDLNEIGVSYYNKSDLDQALANYSDAIRRKPDFAWAYNNRGNAYYAMTPRLLDRAIDDYSEALKIDPDLESAYNNRGNAYQLKGEYDLALQDYDKAIKLNPEYAFAYNGRANTYYLLGDLKAAISAYDNAIRIDPDYIVAQTNRGYAHFVDRDFSRAIEDFDEAIRKFERTSGFSKKLAARAYAGRGGALLIKGHPKQALADFDEAIQRDSMSAFAHSGRGSVLGMNNYPDALASFETAIRCNPEFAAIYLTRGSLYLSRGDLPHAAEDFNKFVELEPKEPWGFVGRGVALALQNQLELGIADLEKAEKLAKDDLSLATFAKAMRLLAKNDLEAATEALNSLISANKEDYIITRSGLYQMRGLVYRAKSSNELAVLDFDEAIKSSPANAFLYVMRGSAYAETNAFKDKAIDDFKRALTLDPANIRALLARAELYERSLEWTEAIADYNTILGLDPLPGDRAQTYLGLGNVFARTALTDQAIELFGKAVELGNPSVKANAHLHRAELYDARQQYELAVSDYKLVLKLAPLSYHVYGAEARAFRGFGQLDEALADYTAQIAKSPRDYRAYDNRGDTYFAAGKYELAVEDYSFALQGDPAFSYAFFDRGKANEALGRFELAMRDYAEAIQQNRKNIRAILRLYLLHARDSGTLAVVELETNIKQVDPHDELFPLTGLFLGKRTVENVSVESGANGCEFLFYLGKWHQLQHNDQSAQQALTGALKVCPKADIPYYDTQLALKY